MPRKSTEPRVACHHCRKWMYYGKGVEHMYASVPHRVHRECHLWLLRREAQQAPPTEKLPAEIILTDSERDALALWLQGIELQEIARYMQHTKASIIGALTRCQNKLGADKLGEEYMQEFEVFQLRQLVRDFAIYATKYHKFWQEEKAERDALLSRAIELACEVPNERYTI